MQAASSWLWVFFLWFFFLCLWSPVYSTIWLFSLSSLSPLSFNKVSISLSWKKPANCKSYRKQLLLSPISWATLPISGVVVVVVAGGMFVRTYVHVHKRELFLDSSFPGLFCRRPPDTRDWQVTGDPCAEKKSQECHLTLWFWWDQKDFKAVSSRLNGCKPAFFPICHPLHHHSNVAIVYLTFSFSPQLLVSWWGTQSWTGNSSGNRTQSINFPKSSMSKNYKLAVGKAVHCHPVNTLMSPGLLGICCSATRVPMCAL